MELSILQDIPLFITILILFSYSVAKCMCAMHSWRSTYLLPKQQHDNDEEAQQVSCHESNQSYERPHSATTSPASQAETSPYPFLTQPRTTRTLCPSPLSSSSPASSSWRGSPFRTKAKGVTTASRMSASASLQPMGTLLLTPPSLHVLEDVPTHDDVVELNKEPIDHGEHVLTIDGNSEDEDSNRSSSTRATTLEVEVDESACSNDAVVQDKTKSNPLHESIERQGQADVQQGTLTAIAEPHSTAVVSLSLPPRVPYLRTAHGPSWQHDANANKTNVLWSVDAARPAYHDPYSDERAATEETSQPRPASPSSPSVTVSSASAPSPSSLRLTRSPSPSPPRSRRARSQQRTVSSQPIMCEKRSNSSSNSCSHKTPSPSPAPPQRNPATVSTTPPPSSTCMPAFLSLTPYLHRTRPLGTVLIELAPGRTEELSIYLNDTAEALADRFMRAHGLTGDEVYLVLFDFLHAQIATLKRGATNEARKASTTPRPVPTSHLTQGCTATNNIVTTEAATAQRGPRRTASTCVKPPAPTRALLLRQQAAAARLAMQLKPQDTLQRGLVHCRRRDAQHITRSASAVRTTPSTTLSPPPHKEAASPLHTTPTRRLFTTGIDASSSARRTRVRQEEAMKVNIPCLPDTVFLHCTPYRGR